MEDIYASFQSHVLHTMWPASNYIQVLINIVWQCKYVPLVSKLHYFRGTLN